jgi:hypothetical protein
MDRLLAFALLAGALLWPVAVAPGQELKTPAAAIGQDEPADTMDVAAEQKSAKCNCARRTCCHGCCIDWKSVPGSIRPLHRPGDFPIPPTGCGYYSLSDALHGICRDKPRKNGYPRFALMPPAFFDADFRYLESMPLCDRNFSEKLKRRQLGDCATFSTGGQFWARYMNERNSRLSAADNEYTLTRVRAYGDLLVGDYLRFFGEFIWADSLGEDLTPLPIDVNLGDALNLFVELNLFDYGGKPVYARIGRQELLFGSQRLVSTLDWANTRRTFDGVRIFRTGQQWDFDLFYTAFVPANPDEFDDSDDSREFAGTWATYRPQKGHFFDFFYLYFENANDVRQQNIVRGPTDVHTLGTRYAGDHCGWLWDFWGALQLGDQDGRDLIAGAYTASVGRNFAKGSWSPTAWICYDYASGDSNPGAGDAHTFNQLYPFGHYYLGWIDQVGRQNIHDLNAHLFLYPSNWITLWLQYHHFWLDQSRDALYNAGGIAIRRDATGAAGRNVGDELDVVVNFRLAENSDVMVGYSQLFGGSFLADTPGPEDAELFFLMFQQRW